MATMTISPRWLRVAITTFVAGFAVLGYLAVRVQQDAPPQPREVRSEAGDLLFTRDDIMVASMSSRSTA